MDNKKCLILGGAGFIGLNLSRRLLETNHTITVVDNFSRGKKDNVLEKLFKILLFSIKIVKPNKVYVKK